MQARIVHNSIFAWSTMVPNSENLCEDTSNIWKWRVAFCVEFQTTVYMYLVIKRHNKYIILEEGCYERQQINV